MFIFHGQFRFVHLQVSGDGRRGLGREVEVVRVVTGAGHLLGLEHNLGNDEVPLGVFVLLTICEGATLPERFLTTRSFVPEGSGYRRPVVATSVRGQQWGFKTVTTIGPAGSVALPIRWLRSASVASRAC